MKDDPAIGRVREARHRISEECGHDPKRLVAYYLERQRQRQEEVKEGSREAEPQKEA